MPDVEFVLAGGRMRGHEALHDSVVYRTAKLPNVRFAGFVPYAEIAEYFGTAELLLSTSDGAQEGFPNVFLQAWSVGLPVISTCDPDGVIEEHGLGSVQDCTSALVDAIRRFRGDTDLREACGNRARAYVMEHHSPDRVGHQLNHLLTELLGADYSTTEPVGEAVTR
ncbi:MAG: glycosyltransferase family 4 protein [Armatimonadota bacterium]